MKTKISLTNSKLGGYIPGVNLPAVLTCRSDAPCKKGCYACKGTWLYKNVQASLQNNYILFINDGKKYFDDIIEFLNNGDISYKFFRWHSSGDIVNYNYLLGMIRTAQECPQTKFLAFTKKFNLVNIYLSRGREIPDNLHIVFSAWDKSFTVDNPFNMPTTYINFKDKTKNADIPEFAIPCTGSCASCKACWSLVAGQSVVFNQH